MPEEYPRNQMELEAMFSTEEACRGYLFRLRWPDGFRLPALWQICVLADPGDSASMRSMQALDFDNRRHNFPGYPYTPHSLVPGNMVGYYSEEWRKRPESTTDSRAEKLRNSMDLVAQVSPGDGSSWSRTSEWKGRGR